MKLQKQSNLEADLISDIQKLIVKINDLLQHPDEAEYLVDLLPEEVIKRYGRERAVEAARVILKNSVSKELSDKCTEIWRDFRRGSDTHSRKLRVHPGRENS